MYTQLTNPRRERLRTGYVPTQTTLTPTGLTSQSNLEKRQPRSPYPNLPLEQALNVSYASLRDTPSKLQPYGYKLDTALSTQQNKVFVQPESKKVVFTTAGTNPYSPRDIATDAYLAFLGRVGLTQTTRYKESKAVLEKAREKYKGYKKVLSGHSLGKTIVSNLANPNEQVKGFGSGSGLFSQGGGESYRTFYDPFSFTSKDTLIPTYIPKKKGNLRGKQKVDYPTGLFPSHSYQNLRSMPTTFV